MAAAELAAPANVKRVDIAVNDGGFSPSTVELKKGEPVVLPLHADDEERVSEGDRDSRSEDREGPAAEHAGRGGRHPAEGREDGASVLDGDGQGDHQRGRLVTRPRPPGRGLSASPGRGRRQRMSQELGVVALRTASRGPAPRGASPRRAPRRCPPRRSGAAPSRSPRAPVWTRSSSRPRRSGPRRSGASRARRPRPACRGSGGARSLPARSMQSTQGPPPT